MASSLAIRRGRSERPITFEEAASSILSFCKKYLPHLCPRPFCPMHGEWETDILADQQLIGYLAPREHAKTTILAIGYPLWRLCMWRWMRRQGRPQTDENIGIFGVTGDVAAARMKQIVWELTHNDALRKDFGPFETIGGDQFVLEGASNVKDPTLYATGFGGTAPGWRLSTALLDDVTDPKRARNPDYRAELWNWLDGLVEPMVREGGIVLAVQTPWHPDDFIMRLLKRSQKEWESSLPGRKWVVRRYRALINEHTGTTLWPEVWPLERLLEKKRRSPRMFAQQYQCEPYEAENMPLPPPAYYDIKRLGGGKNGWTMDDQPLRLSMGVDPNISKSDMNDSMAIVTVGVDPKGNCYVLEVRGGHFSFEKGCQEIIAAYNNWLPENVGIEINMWQQAYAEHLRKNTNMPVREIDNRINKEQRIITTIEPLARNAKLYMLPHHEELIEEWITFPGEHDDYLDGLEMALRYILTLGKPKATLVTNVRGAFSSGWIRTNYGD